MSTTKFLPEIIFEDETLLVIDKPAGMHSVNNPNSQNYSLSQWLIDHKHSQTTASPKSGDAGLVQRLDCWTSGLLIAAKNIQVWQKLHTAILEEEVKKLYLAVVEGQFPIKPICVESRIGNKSRGSKKVTVFPISSGKSRTLYAKTELTSLKYDKKRDISLVEVKLHSATRHQIRAHCAHLLHPLLGDTLYGSKKATLDLGIGELEFLLHASSIKFSHPVSGKMLEFHSDPSWKSLLS